MSKAPVAVQDPGDSPLLRDRAYSSFTQHLLARDFRPGQFVSQREIVAFTGLPLGAIRDHPAPRGRGLLTTIPQRGMQIAHIDLNLIREAFSSACSSSVRSRCAVRPDGAGCRDRPAAARA